MTADYLVSSYNKRAHLPAVLQSVKEDRELTGGRIVLIDDGSQDGSDAICAAFAQQNGVVYFRQQNRGIFGTVNRLVEQIEADWIRFVDCDDPILPGSTAYLIALAERVGTTLAFGAARPYGPAPIIPGEVEAFSGEGARDDVIADALDYSLLGFNFVPTQCVLRVAGLKGIFPLREDLISCQDYAINLRVARTSGFARTDAAVCRQLLGVQNRLSAREALTFHQSVRIIQDVARETFDTETKRKAAAKQIGRAMRWMRHNHKNERLRSRYWRFFLRRQMCRFPGLAIPFDHWIDAVADLYAEEVADLLGGARPY